MNKKIKNQILIIKLSMDSSQKEEMLGSSNQEKTQTEETES